MREGGLLLAGFCLVFVLGAGVALFELLTPVVTKARLDTICASFSEQMALNQSFADADEVELASLLVGAGLDVVEVSVDSIENLKRGEKAKFLVEGEISGRLMTNWISFNDHRYIYRFERFVVCRKILN
ncbi:hypothetical protein [Acidaminobacter hydrogenoformans]|uniref:Uncharacterized protein n=1 Tax=Acidaminobacter hydrogenoformans DSM 2784 TaxID=1120920 RepID=A0A1G5RRH5_9FIRM|nr:hypothetical protein [Acidaminobacter hydrogenoformans]SCZ76644.1 hypothetical protein SAMN03080599_00347 [Acidaminobacter hydrogenoformans DSM 2784]